MAAENSMTGEDMAYDLMPYTQSFSEIAHVTTSHGDASDHLVLAATAAVLRGIGTQYLTFTNSSVGRPIL